jgi:hypothetical protein
MHGSSNKTYPQLPTQRRPRLSSRVTAALAHVARSYSEHPVFAAMAGAAAALVFLFLTVESTLRGVTNAILISFAITIVALAAAATWLSRFAHSEELFNHRKLRRLAVTGALTGPRQLEEPGRCIDSEVGNGPLKRWPTVGHSVGHRSLQAFQRYARSRSWR